MEEKLLNKKTNFRWQLGISVLSEGGKVCSNSIRSLGTAALLQTLLFLPFHV